MEIKHVVTEENEKKHIPTYLVGAQYFEQVQAGSYIPIHKLVVCPFPAETCHRQWT